MVTVRSDGEMPAPAVVVLTTESGAVHRQVVPAGSWLAGARTATVAFEVAEAPARVELDPEGIFLDADPSDDVWTVGAAR